MIKAKSVWKSISELENRDGSLYFEGCDVNDLARQYGTPLYIYSQTRIIDNYHRLVKSYRKHYPKFKVFYAIKANNHPAIAKILVNEGAGIDASCLAEIRLAEYVGTPKDQILYSGVYNSDEDLHYALHHNYRINLEDVSQFERLCKIHIPEFLSFRVNPGIGNGGSEGLVFAGPNAKFGIPEDQISEVYARAQKLGVKRFGIHMMSGSNILRTDYFEEVVNKLMDIAGPISKKLGITFDFIDLGGSLGVPYRPEEPELDIEDVAQKVITLLRKKLQYYGMGEPTLIHEPGRYLVCDAGILIASVTSMKRSAKTFLGLDAGMHTLLRPALYDSYHHILPASKLNHPCDQKMNIVGQICENTDTFATDRSMPSNIDLGDIIAFLNVGAYGFSMSSHYNSRPKPAEVLVSKGQSYLIRSRETFDDLIRGTAIPKVL